MLTCRYNTCVDTVESSPKNYVVKNSVVCFLWRRPHFFLLVRRLCLDPIIEFVVAQDIFDADALANKFIGPIDMTLLAGEDDTIILSW